MRVRSSATGSSCTARDAPSARLVGERAAEKRAIGAKLAAEQRLYNSVRSQIAQLETAQRATETRRRSKPKEQRSRNRRSPSWVAVSPAGTSRPSGTAQPSGSRCKYLGVPYVWGGASPSGFDCSGLVMYVYAQLGVSLPHYTVSQYNYPDAVHPSRSELEPGDLVFFAGLGHVGIYIGNNEFIHAPHTGADVEIDSLTGWYSYEYAGATRILG